MATETLNPETPAGGAGFWNPETDETLVCVDVRSETHDVKSFTFASPEGKHFLFEAGQYFSFELGLDGEADNRCYSISSSPARRNAITVTVKRVAGGKVSNWLHDNLKPGMTVKGQGPLGRFVRPKAEKYLLVSGGSGITPVMSMARDMHDRFEEADVVFLHAARSPDDLIFRHDLTGLARNMKALRLHLLPETTAGEPGWPGLTGRISRDYLALAVPDLAERVVLCCGPAPFMKAVRDLCAALGVPEARYLEESFEAADLLPDDAQPAEVAAKTYKVEFRKQGKTIEVQSGQTVLSSAKRASVKLPSSCATGLCGTCKCKLLSGEVEMKHDGGIRQREIDAGFFLPCCSKPLSDLVIDR